MRTTGKLVKEDLSDVLQGPNEEDYPYIQSGEELVMGEPYTILDPADGIIRDDFEYLGYSSGSGTHWFRWEDDSPGANKNEIAIIELSPQEISTSVIDA
jgi:hypothetical protein